MKYKSGDKVKVINPTFAKTWENMGRKNEWEIDFIETRTKGHPSLWENMGRKNEWEIDFIETRTKGHPSLYICYCVDDSRKMLFHFLEEEVEQLK